jgi:hypothetical protein
MRHDKNDSAAARVAWEMFARTGDIGYYMLYQDLTRPKK